MKDVDVRILIGVWLAGMVLIVSAMIYFEAATTSGPQKRRMFRWYTVAGGVVITTWFTLLGGWPGLLAAIVLFPPSAFISWQWTRFCDACGATHMNQFMRAKFCARCGADLDAQDEERRNAE